MQKSIYNMLEYNGQRTYSVYAIIKRALILSLSLSLVVSLPANSVQWPYTKTIVRRNAGHAQIVSVVLYIHVQYSTGRCIDSLARTPLSFSFFLFFSLSFLFSCRRNYIANCNADGRGGGLDGQTLRCALCWREGMKESEREFKLILFREILAMTCIARRQTYFFFF